MATCQEIFLTQAVSLTTFSQLFYASPKYFLEFPKHFSVWSIFLAATVSHLARKNAGYIVTTEQMFPIL